MPKAKGSKVPARNHAAIRELHLAAIRGDESAARRALAQGAPIDSLVEDNGELYDATARHLPVLAELTKTMGYLFDHDVPLSAYSGRKGKPALYRAADNGNVGVVKLLLQQGASVDLDDDGETPLMKAALFGHLAIVEALIEAGAEVNRVHQDMTPYDYAARSKQKNVARYLRGVGCVSRLDEVEAQEKHSVAEKREPSKQVKLFSTTAHRIKIGARLSAGADSPHAFGGTLDDDVQCRNCETPMHLLLTIDTSAPALKLPPLGRRDFRVVYCLNCMSFPGLLYLDYAKPKLRVVKQAKEDTVNEDEPIELRSVSLSRLEPPTRSASKIGGSPNWIQGPEIPDCVRCKKPMSFIAQLRSMPDLSFVDEGTLYSFVCVKCKVSASLIQSH